MIQVLLVDDEPLVLIGMQSMLNWGKAGAGNRRHRPKRR